MLAFKINPFVYIELDSPKYLHNIYTSLLIVKQNMALNKPETVMYIKGHPKYVSSKSCSLKCS